MRGVFGRGHSTTTSWSKNAWPLVLPQTSKGAGCPSTLSLVLSDLFMGLRLSDRSKELTRESMVVCGWNGFEARWVQMGWVKGNVLCVTVLVNLYKFGQSVEAFLVASGVDVHACLTETYRHHQYTRHLLVPGSNRVSEAI